MKIYFILGLIVLALVDCVNKEKKPPVFLQYIYPVSPITIKGILLDNENKPLDSGILEVSEKDVNALNYLSRVAFNYYPERFTTAKQTGEFQLKLDKSIYVIQVKSTLESLGAFEIDLRNNQEPKPLIYSGSKFNFNGKVDVK